MVVPGVLAASSGVTAIPEMILTCPAVTGAAPVAASRMVSCSLPEPTLLCVSGNAGTLTSPCTANGRIVVVLNPLVVTVPV